MKLIMTLLVRDADDLISSTLDFHLDSGVDHFIVMDNLSVDRTQEFLRPYERQGTVTYLHQPDDTFDQARWVTSMARLAHDLGADWVINGDADEFWYTGQRDLKRALSKVPPEFQAVHVERKHFVPRPLQPHEHFADALTVRYTAALSPSGAPWPGKVCHRSLADVEVGYGNHTAVVAGVPLATATASIEILHFPIRSYAKFERVVVNGGAASGRNPDRPVKRWENLYAAWKRQDLRSYYDSLVPDEAELLTGLEDGRYTLDERLKSALSSSQRIRA